MKLWNLGLLSGLAVWLMFIDPAQDIGWYSVVGFSSLVLIHVAAEAQGRHQGNPRFILLASAITMYVFQWDVGADAIWISLLTLSSLTIAFSRKEKGIDSALISLMIGLLTVR